MQASLSNVTTRAAPMSRWSGIEPLGDLLRRWAMLAALAAALALVLRILNLNLFGYSQLETPRSWFTIFFLLHLYSCFLSFERTDEIALITVTPFLSQLFHICLGWDVDPGALSVVRVLPYIVITAAMVMALVRRGYCPSSNERIFAGIVLAVSACVWLIGSRHSMVGVTITFLLGVFLPVFAFYIAEVASRDRSQLLHFSAAVTLGVLALMVGFLAALALGSSVETSRGTGSIASAREVGDFNSLISYMLLSWPFAVLWARRRSTGLTVLLFMLLAICTFAGLSKTMMLLAPPLLALSLAAALPRLSFETVSITLLLIVLIVGGVVWAIAVTPVGQLIADLWVARLNLDTSLLDSLTLADFLRPVAFGSEAWDDRSALQVEALQLFLENPVLGTGWATFPFLSVSEQGTAHSLTADMLQQAGVVGALIFWAATLEVLCRLLQQIRTFNSQLRSALLFPASFAVWLIAAHSVGAQLFIAANSGFVVSAITGMLYVLYLRREVIFALLTDVGAR